MRENKNLPEGAKIKKAFLYATLQTKRRKTMQEKIQEQHGSFLIEDNNDDGRRRTRSSLRGTPTSTEKSPVPAKRARTTATTPTSAKKGRTPAKKNLVQAEEETVRSLSI